ncbi:dUMP phosphatase [Psychrosphaera saromensis]|uniref:Noncanonical pyrimidine nucleotidase, YjjG family n=1 Tax=Psychrosphaera saromensis TaxID=716813 RepID=A0A2S7UUW2_9GAMM|nr:pyrimidine 5'-nucleotidase [Psychrosphaera saromensis]PQJ53071.1 noncanonical pyrimidine nucleotidase, YjjG family [Psychrosphaera saromensis]GHB68306.1 dUMP phosphatase [Psychrosphaera saromensis]GLQ15179.1 dUMP phosphatase [Psychrosphaera saromensis]
MKYQWVLFDADETLFHFDILSGLTCMFARYGVNFIQSDFDEYQSVNKPLWVQYQNGEISAQQLQITRFTLWGNKLNVQPQELNEQFLDAMAEICKPLDGALALVTNLHKRGVKMGIITNGFAQLQEIRLQRTGFKPYFSPVVISELVGVAKPHPDIFTYALTNMNNPAPEQVLMVGDTLESDILGGNNAGFDTCWLNHHNVSDSKSTSTAIKPTYQVTSLTKLLVLLAE